MQGRFSASPLRIAVCAGLVLFSALLVVSETHQTRLLFTKLQAQESERWHLQERYSRLLLEYSTLSAPHRISALSQTSLAMKSPNTGSIRVVAQ